MGMGVVEKILSEHAAAAGPGGGAGAELALHIDQTLTQDATGTMAFLQFESMGLNGVRNELAVSYVDHNTIQVGSENADDHAYLQSVAARYGVVFSRPGNGICHQVHLERFGVPGKTLLGSDSHTPTAGGLGMLAIGAGGIDVAVAMGGGSFCIPAPRIVKLELVGTMPAWVSAKDAALKVLERFTTKGNVGTIFEYGGPALDGLDVPERATMANMGAECGVTSSVFPSDDRTRLFLAAQGRVEFWRPLTADSDADYDDVVEIDLGSLEPLAATPHSPGNIATVAALDGLAVDQVLIGSCTNSSYRDLATVAGILKGQHVAPGVSLGVAPGSRQVLRMLARGGVLATLLDAGARLLESACGFCIGNSLSPRTGSVSLRTSNRNFEGRSGTASAQVYLVSPETAAVAAIRGCVCDPRAATDLVCPRIEQPAVFDVDDSLIVFPACDEAERGRVAVVKGPNIGQVPTSGPLPARLDGIVSIKVGDKVTTDHIMPAGERLKYRSNVPAYARYVFEKVDPSFSERAAANRDAGLHNVVVAGDSYGQGSSREHAALCPMYLGVRAVVAKSIERIHRANLINVGIVPFLFETGTDYERLSVGQRISIEGVRDAVAGDGRCIVSSEDGAAISVRMALSARERTLLLAGGLQGSICRKEDCDGVPED